MQALKMQNFKHSSLFIGKLFQSEHRKKCLISAYISNKLKVKTSN